jgi:hypothetical protein
MKQFKNPYYFTELFTKTKKEIKLDICWVISASSIGAYILSYLQVHFMNIFLEVSKDKGRGIAEDIERIKGRGVYTNNRVSGSRVNSRKIGTHVSHSLNLVIFGVT